MLNDTEKTLEEIICFALDPEKKTESKLKLQHLLLNNTNNGKLYKYRSFDNAGFSVKNLKEGTLHCARPDTFNDPFDCRLGITYTSVADALIDHPTLDKTLSTVIAFFQRKKAIKECTDDEQTLIKRLEENSLLYDMLNGRKLSDSEKESAFKSIIKEVELFTAQRKLGHIPEGLADYIEKMDVKAVAAMESEPTLSDYIASTGFVSGDKDEIGKMLEFAASIKPGSEQKAQEANEWFSQVELGLAKQISDTFLVGCLAGDPKQRLMWSHYSDGHKGFCVEYDLKALLDKEPALFPVVYSKKRPLIPFDAVSDSTKADSLSAKINMIQALLTKDSCWEYESEWRLIIPAIMESEVEIPITAVFLGANIEEENKDKILEIAKERKIPVKQMRTDRGEYELHAEDLLSFEGE